MKVRSNRAVERAAVNAARSLFEASNHVFQEVDLGNDYGKDVYVDISENGVLTGLCIALQVKGGKKYKRADGYAIPLDEPHARVWSQSSLPVAGIVYDPADGQLRWCNITEFLNAGWESLPNSVPVERSRVLNADTLENDFKRCFRGIQSQSILNRALLQLVNTDAPLQVRALKDCFILGRNDIRVLTLIRRLLLGFKGEVLRIAVIILAHATPHPDLFFGPQNIISEETCQLLALELRWSQDEIGHLMRSVERDEWHRGGQGQHIYSLSCVDPAIDQQMTRFAHSAILEADDEVAFWAMYLVIYWAGSKGPVVYERFVADNSLFSEIDLADELRLILAEQGQVTLFE